LNKNKNVAKTFASPDIRNRQVWMDSHLINAAVWSTDIDSSWNELLKQIKAWQNKCWFEQYRIPRINFKVY